MWEVCGHPCSCPFRATTLTDTEVALFGIAWGGPVTGATHTYLTQKCMNFHFTFPARLAPPLLRPFQVLVPAIVVARRYWDSILARLAGREGPSQPKPALMLLPHCDAIMHP